MQNSNINVVWNKVFGSLFFSLCFNFFLLNMKKKTKVKSTFINPNNKTNTNEKSFALRV